MHANSIKAPAAIRVDLAAIFVSLELSRSKWLVTSLSPGGGEKMSRHIVLGGDVPGLLDHFAELQRKVECEQGRAFESYQSRRRGWTDAAFKCGMANPFNRYCWLARPLHG